METTHYSILIDAPKEKVWNTMLNDKTYREWTKSFHEGSYYEGSWEKGSEIRFLGPSKEGELQGMYSRIKENIPYQFISIEHLGQIKNGVIDTTSEEVKKWAPSYEDYSFIEKSGQTQLKVDMKIPSEYKVMFDEMWQKALQKLKQLSEQKLNQ
ncbi:MAG: SRPBCC domain-containing protein [Bacteroidota bacterium]